MNPTHPNLHSTRLENLGLEPYGVRFDLDGRTVQIRGDSRTPLVGALQAFHRQALEDYRAHEAQPRPGWFSRLKSWVGRFLGGSPRDSAEPGGSAPSDAPHRAGRVEVLPDGPHRPAVAAHGPTLSWSSADPACAARAAGAGSEGKNRDPGRARAADPILRAVYADKDGVHLIWQAAGAKPSAKPVAMTCNLDSQLAERLQDCYGHLAELGYKVAGLELLRPEPAPAGNAGKSPEKADPSRAAAGAATAVAGATVSIPAPEADKMIESASRPKIPRIRSAPPKPAAPKDAAAPEPAVAMPEEKKILLPEPT